MKDLYDVLIDKKECIIFFLLFFSIYII